MTPKTTTNDILIVIRRLPTIPALVPGRNEEANINRYLLAIVDQNYPSNKITIIVVDNGSTDGTLEQKQLFPDGHNRPLCKLIFEPT